MHDPGRDAVRDAWLRSKRYRVPDGAYSQIVLYPDSVLDEICKATSRQR